MLVQILTEHAIDLFGGRVEQIAGRVHPPGKVDAVAAGDERGVGEQRRFRAPSGRRPGERVRDDRGQADP